jgi:hypothetical protein
MNKSNTTKPVEQPVANSPDLSKIKGEGDYESARRYNEATKKFVESDKVEDAAKNAAPKSVSEAKELEAAEQKGLERSKGEDPSAKRP